MRGGEGKEVKGRGGGEGTARGLLLTLIASISLCPVDHYLAHCTMPRYGWHGAVLVEGLCARSLGALVLQDWRRHFIVCIIPQRKPSSGVATAGSNSPCVHSRARAAKAVGSRDVWVLELPAPPPDGYFADAAAAVVGQVFNLAPKRQQ